jgi:hypothetical protein
MERESTEVWITQNYEKRKETLNEKMKEISERKAHINTLKLH